MQTSPFSLRFIKILPFSQRELRQFTRALREFWENKVTKFGHGTGCNGIDSISATGYYKKKMQSYLYSRSILFSSFASKQTFTCSLTTPCISPKSNIQPHQAFPHTHRPAIGFFLLSCIFSRFGCGERPHNASAPTTCSLIQSSDTIITAINDSGDPDQNGEC